MNAIAKYIKDRGVTKHMPRHQAVTIWKALKAEGWVENKNTLTHEDGEFVFCKAGTNKTSITYLALEVAQ